MGENKLMNTIKVHRAMKNLTQEQLADLASVTRKTINTIERGKFIPSTVLALKLARIFVVPVETLFKLPDEEV